MILSWIIAQLGLIKDDGLMIETIQELEDQNNEAEMLLKKLNINTCIEDLLLDSQQVIQQFIKSKCLDYLLI